MVLETARKSNNKNMACDDKQERNKIRLPITRTRVLTYLILTTVATTSWYSFFNNTATPTWIKQIVSGIMATAIITYLIQSDMKKITG